MDPDAPLALCAGHLRLAADWSAARDDVEDLLPGPCAVCGSRTGIRYPSGWSCAVCEWRYGELPDADLAPPRVDVVYYIRFGDRVKIGTSSNPRSRLAHLWHDEVLAFERGDRRLERRRHERFAAQRLRGEWFRLDDDLERHIASVAAGVERPWDLHARWLSEALALRG